MVLEPLDALLAEVRACRICAGDLPLGPRPVLRASVAARILIAGQAPGTKVHESGIPWDDPSGERLRHWLAVERETFYDEGRIAIVPMGFCYPGRHPRGGDLPPRPECAAAWHDRLMAALARVELIVLAGAYAHAYHLGPRRKRSLTETVRAHADYAPRYVPLPHPSWRTIGWQKRNPWFEAEVLPLLRRRVAELL